MSRMPRIRPTGAALVVGTMIGAVALAGCGAGQITQTSSQISAVGGASGNAGPIAVRDAVIAFVPAAETAVVYPRGGSAPLQMTIANSGATADTLVSASSPAAASVQITGAADIADGQIVVVGGAPPAPTTTAAAPTLTPSGSAAPGATASATPGSPVIPSGSALPTTAAAAPTGPPSPLAPKPALTTNPGPGGFNPAGPNEGTVQNPSAVDEGTHVVLTGLKDDVRSGLTYPLVLTFAKAGDVRINVPVALSTETREAEPTP